jgi:hypothetical protein
MMEADDAFYWAVDLPGLTGFQALEIRNIAAELNGVVGASVLDPAVFLTIALDRVTVEALVIALRTAAPSDEIVASMLEWFEEWLINADPVPDL